MSWPLASHFSAVLQNPKVAFRDPGLRQCVIEKNAQGQPRPWAGAFAVVYKATDVHGQNPFAVRVFTTESPERRERYAAVSQYLEHRQLDCLCDFEYRDESIRSASDGKWYPLILMEWVEGQTLFRWAREKCLAGDTDALAEVAERWVEVVRELNEASLAHGDLQHGNVMVTPRNELKLVDYDCMCVPALVGRRNLEVGVEPYQHPARDAQTLLTLDLDNFSALVIFAALKALAANPGLWAKYVDGREHDKLLFHRDDILRPGESELYRELQSTADPETRRLVEQLCDLAHMPMDRVPALSQVASSYAKVEALLKRQQWEAAVDLLNRRGHFRDAPEEIKPLIHRAYQHVCRQQAWKAFRRVPDETTERCDRQVVEAWNEELFSGFSPAEQQRVRVAEARRRVQMVDSVYRLVQQLADEVTLDGERRIVDAAARLPQGYEHSQRDRVEKARRRVQAMAKLQQQLDNPRIEAAMVAAARSLIALGGEEMLDRDQRRRVKLAMRRAPLLRQLDELDDNLPADQRDRQLAELWRQADWNGCPEAERWRQPCEQAGRRVEWLRRLERAAEAGEVEQVAELRANPPEGLDPMPGAYAKTVDEAQAKVDRVEGLERALQLGDTRAFAQHFDATIIHRLAERFAPYRERISQWTREEILPTKRLGLRKLSGWGSITAEDDPPGRFRLRWHWPEPRMLDRCLITLSPEEPADDDDPDTMATYETAIVERPGYEQQGNQFGMTVDPAWIGAHVAVWGLVDLGFETVRGGPVPLGRLKPASRWKRLAWGQ